MESNLIGNVRRLGRRLLNAGASLQGTIKVTRGALVAYWFNPTANWGDAINPFLIRALSGKDVVHQRNVLYPADPSPVYSVVGSILDHLKSPNSVVWGSGFMLQNSKMAVRPAKICAVRGPLSRDVLLRAGISCPPVYGDPAILMPILYKPKINKIRYTLGVIPHYIHRKEKWVGEITANENVLLIDVFSDTKSFIDKICQCEHIASSSLHGLIVADAYGKPFTWIEMGAKLKGNRFKFYDYFAAVGKEEVKPLLVHPGMGPADVVLEGRRGGADIDLGPLVDACPFLGVGQKEYIYSMIG